MRVQGASLISDHVSGERALPDYGHTWPSLVHVERGREREISCLLFS